MFVETFWCHNVTWKSGCFLAPEKGNSTMFKKIITDLGAAVNNQTPDKTQDYFYPFFLRKSFKNERSSYMEE